MENKKNGKFKKFISQTGKGARQIGSTVAKGASSLAKKGYDSYKEYQSPEGQRKRLDNQIAIEQRRQKLAKIRSQQRPTGVASNLFGAAPPMFGGGMGIDIGGGSDIGGGLNNAFGIIGGSPAPQRTVTVRRYYKPKKRSKSKRRVRVIRKVVSQPAAFDPFSQFWLPYFNNYPGLFGKKRPSVEVLKMIGKTIKPGFLLKVGRKGKFLGGTIKEYGNKKGMVRKAVK